METKLILLPDGTLFEITGRTFDAAAAAASLIPSVANLELNTSNAQATITEQVNNDISRQQSDIDAQVAKLQAALAADPTLADTIQPQLEALNAQYPTIAANLPSLAKSATPATPAQPAPAQQ